MIMKSILYHSGKRISHRNISTMAKSTHMVIGVLKDLWTSLRGVFIIRHVMSLGVFRSATN